MMVGAAQSFEKVAWDEQHTPLPPLKMLQFHLQRSIQPEESMALKKSKTQERKKVRNGGMTDWTEWK